MADLHHYIGDDLHLSPTGDLLVASGTIVGQQRVLRRLLTNQSDYIWHTSYGASLPQEVGNQKDSRRIRGIVRGEMLKEAVVARTPDPSVLIADIKNGVSARIQYVDSTTGQQVSLAFDINR